MDPKGIGALYVRAAKPRVKLKPMIDGGGHERGMRSGTLNVPGIVGLGKACEIAQQEMTAEAERLISLSERLKKNHRSTRGSLRQWSSDGAVSGQHEYELCLCRGRIAFDGLKEIAVSTGSACTSASLEPSHVLRAIGVEEELAHTSIRFGLGRFNTEEEVDYTVRRVVEEVQPITRTFAALQGKKSETARATTGREWTAGESFLVIGYWEESMYGRWG